MSQRALITGASGAFGTALRTALRERGWQVAGLDLRPDPDDPDVLACDITDADADALRAEYGSHVGVTCVHPAFVRTPIHDTTRAAGLRLEGFSHEEPLERVIAKILHATQARRPACATKPARSTPASTSWPPSSGSAPSSPPASSSPPGRPAAPSPHPPRPRRKPKPGRAYTQTP